MSPHLGADGLVQGELPLIPPEFLTVFTSLACYLGALPGYVRTVGSPYHVAATYPFWAARLFLLCVSWEVFATPTKRYHGRMLIRPSSSACATPRQGVCTHSGSGPSRVRRRLLSTCLGDPISLAIDHLFFTSDFRQVPRRNFLQFSHFLSTAAFAAGIFMARGIGINL